MGKEKMRRSENRRAKNVKKNRKSKINLKMKKV